MLPCAWLTKQGESGFLYIVLMFFIDSVGMTLHLTGSTNIRDIKQFLLPKTAISPFIKNRTVQPYILVIFITIFSDVIPVYSEMWTVTVKFIIIGLHRLRITIQWCNYCQVTVGNWFLWNHITLSSPGVGVTKAPFVNSPVGKKFRSCLSTYSIICITFIFDWCHRSWAAATPVKYERDIQ